MLLPLCACMCVCLCVLPKLSWVCNQDLCRPLAQGGQGGCRHPWDGCSCGVAGLAYSILFICVTMACLCDSCVVSCVPHVIMCCCLLLTHVLFPVVAHVVIPVVTHVLFPV